MKGILKYLPYIKYLTTLEMKNSWSVYWQILEEKKSYLGLVP